MTKEFRYLSDYVQKIGDDKACAPIAVSLATGTPINEVLELFRIVGRQKGRGSRFEWTSAIIKHLGYDLTEHKFRSKTVRTLQRELPVDGIFLVSVNRHILCYRYGKLHDWTDNRLHRVKYIYEVTER